MVSEEPGEETWAGDEDEEHDTVYTHTVLVEVFDEASGRWFALPDRIGARCTRLQPGVATRRGGASELKRV